MKLLTEQELTDSIASILGEVVKACYDLDQTKGKVVAVIDSSISEYKSLIQSQKQAHADMVIGENDTLDRRSFTAIGCVARNTLRTEQHERNAL